MKVYAGIDLHSNNSYISIIDEAGRVLDGKRVRNELHYVIEALRPYYKQLQGVVVESTYNWYWLVDGLQAQGVCVHLANPAAIQQYNGMKHTDDKTDARWLAEMNRLHILPEGYIYPKEERGVRDLLRKRSQLVQQRTTNLLSIQTIIARETGQQVSGSQIKQSSADELMQLLQNKKDVFFAARANWRVMLALNEEIKEIEKYVLSIAKLRPEFKQLHTVPGIGDILALAIMLETGDISRFKEVGNFSSYCRCVDSKRISNEKKKGENNRKNGNKYLSWAFIEAAHYAIRYEPKIKKFYQKKSDKSHRVVALRPLLTS